MWQPCLLTDWDEISNLYRGPSIDAAYQVSFHLAKRFQRRRFLEIEQFGLAVSEKIFRNQPIRNKNCLWQPCLLWIRTKSAIFIEDSP
jgi:hypothetical protein